MRKKRRTWLWIVLAILIIGGIGSQMNKDKESGAAKAPAQKTKAATVAAEKTVAPTEKEETREEYIASCEQIAFDEIMRNPNKYEGQRIRIEGEISQYLEGGFLKEEAFTLYEDYDIRGDSYLKRRWLVAYTQPDENRILVDDIVTFYGEFTGLTEITTILGEKRTEPRIEAKYHEINN